MYFIRYFLHLKLQGIICMSAAMAWNYLRFSLVFEKEFYVSNGVHWHLLKLFFFLIILCIFEYVIYFLLLFLYFNLNV